MFVRHFRTSRLSRHLKNVHTMRKKEKKKGTTRKQLSDADVFQCSSKRQKKKQTKNTGQPEPPPNWRAITSNKYPLFALGSDELPNSQMMNADACTRCSVEAVKHIIYKK